MHEKSQNTMYRTVSQCFVNWSLYWYSRITLNTKKKYELLIPTLTNSRTQLSFPCRYFRSSGRHPINYYHFKVEQSLACEGLTIGCRVWRVDVEISKEEKHVSCYHVKYYWPNCIVESDGDMTNHMYIKKRVSCFVAFYMFFFHTWDNSIVGLQNWIV
jgi:hypothetical protein